MAKKVTNEEIRDSRLLSDFVRRDEFEDLLARMKYVETKLGIESGK